MRLLQIALVAITILCSSFGAISQSTKSVISCASADLDSMPGNWSIDDQSCLRLDLGINSPGNTIFFEISANMDIDILMFPANTISVYQNEQTYRMESVWESDSVFESFTGSGEWHWEVPEDWGETRWYPILDNLDHPQDGGAGSNGGNIAEISLNAGQIPSQLYKLSDSIHRVGSNDFEIAHGPFSIDEGSHLTIHAMTMQGFPDIFVMTESAFSSYSPSSNWSISSRLVSADMLLVSDELFLHWDVSNTNGEEIYVIVDNRPGPNGGGAGTNPAAVTLTISVTPILQPTISSESSLDSVDVGETILLSAMNTPNKSDQFTDSDFSWDFDADGSIETIGPTISQKWENPGNYSIKLSAISADSQSASSIETVRVIDKSDPLVNIESSDQIVKGFGETLVLSGTFSDNWGIEKIEWYVDGTEVFSDSGFNPDDISTTEYDSTLSFEITSEYLPGDHNISLHVTDRSGRTSSDEVKATFMDVTPPLITNFQSEMEVMEGDLVLFQMNALDNESDRIEFSWIFNQGTPEQIEKSGPQIFHEFNTTGPRYVVCIVENEAGLQTTAEILVDVSGTQGNSDDLKLLFFFVMVIVMLLSISAVAYWRYNIAVGMRISEISKESQTSQSTDKPEKTADIQENWPSGENSDLAFRPPPQYSAQPKEDDNISEILGVESEQTASSDFPLDELLAGLEFDAEAQTEEEEEIVRQCSSCSKTFQVTLPAGIDKGVTNCPHCDSEQLVERSS